MAFVPCDFGHRFTVVNLSVVEFSNLIPLSVAIGYVSCGTHAPLSVAIGYVTCETHAPLSMAIGYVSYGSHASLSMAIGYVTCGTHACMSVIELIIHGVNEMWNMSSTCHMWNSCMHECCTLIDNIFCNTVDEVESSGVITTNISDNYPVFSREKVPTLPEDLILINYRDFSDENLPKFKNSLQDINWNPVLINDDADEAYDLFQSILLTVLNEHFPIQTKNIFNCGKSKPWITPGIL